MTLLALVLVVARFGLATPQEPSAPGPRETAAREAFAADRFLPEADTPTAHAARAQWEALTAQFTADAAALDQDALHALLVYGMQRTKAAGPAGDEAAELVRRVLAELSARITAPDGKGAKELRDLASWFQGQNLPSVRRDLLAATVPPEVPAEGDTFRQAYTRELLAAACVELSRPDEARRWLAQAEVYCRTPDAQNAAWLQRAVAGDWIQLYVREQQTDAAARALRALHADASVAWTARDFWLETTVARMQAGHYDVVRLYDRQERELGPLDLDAQLRRALSRLRLAQRDSAPFGTELDELARLLEGTPAGQVAIEMVDHVIHSLFLERRDTEVPDWLERLDRWLADPSVIDDPNWLWFGEAVRAAAHLRLGEGSEVLLADRELLRRRFESFLALERGRDRSPGTAFFRYGFNQAMPATLVTLELALQDGQAGVEAALGIVFQLHSLAKLTPDEPDVALADVRASLVGEDRGVLLYMPRPITMGSSLAFTIDREGVACFSVADQNRWQDDRRKVMTIVEPTPASDLAGALDPADRVQLERIGERFLPADLRARVAGWTAMTVLGADLLGSLPFDALELPGEGPFGLRWAIDHPHGLGFAVDRARRPLGDADEHLLIAGPAVGSARLARAGLEPFVWDEPLQEPWTGLGLPTWSGAEATLARWVAHADRSLGLLAILAHGSHDADGPTILLAGDDDAAGTLTLGGVADLPRAECVLLASCGGGRAGALGLDAGRDHLGGAFLAAGSSAVLLSPSTLPADSADRLFADVADRVLRGAPPAVALRDARRALVAREPAYAHPHHFGSLRIQGYGQRPLFVAAVPYEPAEERSLLSSAGGGPWVWPASALAVGGLAVGWISRRRRRGAGCPPELRRR